jgi:hypothetical protein
MTIIQEISSKEEFESAVATPDKFVFVYIYDTEIPAAAKESVETFSYHPLRIVITTDLSLVPLVLSTPTLTRPPH